MPEDIKYCTVEDAKKYILKTLKNYDIQKIKTCMVT
jgi:hypothetical protein